jgi:hypothetical protein
MFAGCVFIRLFFFFVVVVGVLCVQVGLAGCGSVVVGCGVGRPSFELKHWCLGGSFKKGSGYISTVCVNS